jgi:hypothetical protein
MYLIFFLCCKGVALLFAGLFLCAISAGAQQVGGPVAAVPQVPDAPQPQIVMASSSSFGNDSSLQIVSVQTAGEKGAQHQETVQSKDWHGGGFMSSRNISYRSDAPPLTKGQKMGLALYSTIEPITFAKVTFMAGYHEAKDDDTGFGWGADGYGKRVGAQYLDTIDSKIIGDGFLPILLHQDPRYFRRGHGSLASRTLYAVSTSVICKHDSGEWEPNYSKLGGNFASKAISNLYYPSGSTGVNHTFRSGAISIGTSSLLSVFYEFWPDASRKFLHRDPTHGLDVQMRTADKQ